jgi:hypothetical protein
MTSADRSVQCAEHSIIHQENDTLQELGTVQLHHLRSETYKVGDFIAYNDTNENHQPETFSHDTLTVNFLGREGDQKIHVYVLHELVLARPVLMKADTLRPVPEDVSSAVIAKTLRILSDHFVTPTPTADETKIAF